MNALEFHNVTKRFGKTIVLEDASASVWSGITGLLGVNGSGKTTLLRIIAGLLDYDRGQFFFNGEKVSLESKFWRAKIGYLPQSPALYDRMTVDEFFDYMLLLSGWRRQEKRRQRIEEVINLLDLVLYRNAPLGHLSGGTKQRVAIGQAIIHDPLVLLLDEPANNLDAEERIRFHNYLVAQSRERIVLYVGHVVSDLPLICSRIMVLAARKIRFEGTPEELINLMHGSVKEALLPKLQDLSSGALGILRISRNGDYYIVRYDSRFGDLPNGCVVTPTLEEAYRAFCNSLKLEGAN